MKSSPSRKKLNAELLEPRLVLSFVFGFGTDAQASDDAGSAVETDLRGSEHHNPGHGGGPGGGGPPGGGGGPGIDLPTVAAHELGHSLGLAHSNHPDCGTANGPLMCPFYGGESFELHPEDVSRIQAVYSGSGGWSDTNITYSFTPDRARMDQGRNKLFSTMNDAFGTAAVWQGIFADALDLWAQAENSLSFTEVPDDGSNFNVSGASQGDSRFGDIRIGSHRFDGSSGTLAHAFFPPPNGATAAGDAHFDSSENWQDQRGGAIVVGDAPHNNHHFDPDLADSDHGSQRLISRNHTNEFVPVMVPVDGSVNSVESKRDLSAAADDVVEVARTEMALGQQQEAYANDWLAVGHARRAANQNIETVDAAMEQLDGRGLPDELPYV